MTIRLPIKVHDLMVPINSSIFHGSEAYLDGKLNEKKILKVFQVN